MFEEINNARPSFASVVARGNDVATVTRGLNSVAINNSVRKQGIAFDALLENVPIEVYLEAISKVVPPKYTTHISKASRQIQVYFASEMWAEKMITNGIEVRDYHLDIRPLAISPIKITISNVPPEICPNWLRNELGKFGRVVGPMKVLFAATSRPEFSHIKSFRRTVLMEFDNDETLEKLPRQLNFSLDGKPYSFYISVDVKCFKCGQMGHIRRSCPNSQPFSFTDTNSEKVNEENIAKNKDHNKETDMEIPPQEDLESAAQEQPAVSTPAETDFPVISQEDRQLKKKDKKQLKRRSSPTVEATGAKVFAQEEVPKEASCEDSQVTPPGSETDYHTGAESDTDSQCSDQVEPGLLDTFRVTTPLDATELLKFLNDVKGSPRRLHHAQKYTNNFIDLVSQLKSLSNHLRNNPIKSKALSWERVKRVSTKLKEELKSRS